MKKILKYFNPSFGVYAVFFLIFFLIFQNLYAEFGDDASFRSYPLQYTLFEFLKMHYETWSSRIIVEAMFWWVLSAPFGVWSIVSALFMTGIIFSLCYLFRAVTISAKSVVGLMVLSVPLYFYTNSGWIVTVCYYVWSLGLLGLALCSVRDKFDDKKIGALKTFGYLLVTLIAGNMEQYCLVLLGFLSLALIYFWGERRKIYPIFVAQIGCLLVDILLVFLCIGNKNRSVTEASRWLNDFFDWGPVTKATKGLTHLADFIFIDHYLMGLILLLSTFAMLIAYFDRKKESGIWWWLISLVLGTQIFCYHEQWPLYYGIDNALGWDYLWLAGLLFCVCVLLYLALDIKQFLLVFMCLAVGVASLAVLGFSPTLYVSCMRIFIMPLYVLLGVNAYLYCRYAQKVEGLKYAVSLFLILSMAAEIYFLLMQQTIYLYDYKWKYPSM